MSFVNCASKRVSVEKKTHTPTHRRKTTHGTPGSSEIDQPIGCAVVRRGLSELGFGPALVAVSAA